MEGSITGVDGYVFFWGTTTNGFVQAGTFPFKVGLRISSIAPSWPLNPPYQKANSESLGNIMMRFWSNTGAKSACISYRALWNGLN